MTLKQLTIAIIILINYIINKIDGQETIKSSCGRRMVHHEALITNGFGSNYEWPWHAAIYHVTSQNAKYKCGGTVLNSNTILTAAHCVYENNRPIVPERVTVQLGKQNLKIFSTNSQEFEVHKVIPHPSYSTSDLINDIAIIKLSTEATLNKYVQPICLWDSSKVDLSEVTGKYGTVIGFGVTETDELSHVLRQATMPVVSLLTCLNSNRNFFGSFLSDTSFCAGFRNGTSVCNGDSGGSITFQENGVYRIRGIVSLTVARQDKQLCNSKEYVLFTDVAKYLTWIQDTVPDLKKNSVTKSVFHVPNQGELNFQQSGNVMWSLNCDFFGGDFENHVSKKEDCGNICSNNKKCTHFTWISPYGGLCILKRFGVVNPTASKKINDGALCGWIDQPKGLERFDFQLSRNVYWSEDCDFFGGDFKNQISRKDDCGEICSRHALCTHFTWLPWDGRGLCVLKNFAVNQTVSTKKDHLCGFIDRHSADQRFDFQASGSTRWNSNCDFSGNDFGNEKSNAEHCAGICEENRNCTHFNWTSYQNGTCWLKGPVGISIPNHKFDENALCGFFVWGWRVAGEVRWNHNCEFIGDDISNQKSSRKECGQLCSSRVDCYNFSWTTHEGGTCWLKGSRVTQKATESNDESAVCGFIFRE